MRILIGYSDWPLRRWLEVGRYILIANDDADINSDRKGGMETVRQYHVTYGSTPDTCFRLGTR